MRQVFRSLSFLRSVFVIGQVAVVALPMKSSLVARFVKSPNPHWPTRHLVAPM